MKGLFHSHHSVSNYAMIFLILMERISKKASVTHDIYFLSFFLTVLNPRTFVSFISFVGILERKVRGNRRQRRSCRGEGKLLPSSCLRGLYKKRPRLEATLPLHIFRPSSQYLTLQIQQVRLHFQMY